jgi:hypothetical protein
LAESKYREWKEKEAKDMLEKVRQQHHFESTWRTGSIEIFIFVTAVTYPKLSYPILSYPMLEKVRQQHHFESTWRTGSIVIFRIEKS